jgi:hypothetical protein
MDRDSILLEVVRTAAAAGSFAGGLHSWQQQGDKDADDRNDHQQFDKRKSSSQRNGELLHRMTPIKERRLDRRHCCRSEQLNNSTFSVVI